MTGNRYIHAAIAADLDEEKMVFIGGSRQVGKTTLAISFLDPARLESSAYINWDAVKNRPALLRGELPDGKVLVFDEIHKFARWRNLIKGFYDTEKNRRRFLVTGSARLDHYRKGGDSLQGRYHYYRLHPFTLPELGAQRGGLEQLLKFGGFPEPLFRGEERFWRRWQAERLERVVYEDLRDLEHVREISLIELLLSALPERVGSPLSVKSVRELLTVAHESVERWITILENLYVCFRIPPYGSTRIRAVKKEQKLYFWDWSQAPEGGPRFENLVASHLLKYCHFLRDTEGFRMELRFIRDTDKREIDFVVLKNGRPEFAVECKSGDRTLCPVIAYFRERTPIPRSYQAHLGSRVEGTPERGRIVSFEKFCHEMSLV